MEKDVRLSLRDKIFREAVANLLVHREYLHQFPARIIIYHGQVEFTNPCNPVYNGNIDNDDYLPNQKNPIISKFFLQLGWVEEIGSGIYNIKKYLPFYTPGRKAIFNEDIVFTTIIPIPTPEDTMEVTMQDKTTIHDDLQFSEQATLHDTLHDNPQIINLLNILQEEGEISRDYLLTKLDLNDRSNLRNSYLKPALKADLIELTLPEKLKSKKQKYRLTEKGKTFLKNIQVTPEVTPEATMQDKTAIHNDLQVSDQITMQDTMQVTPEATMQDKIAIHDDLQISDQITMQDTMQVAPKTTMQDKTTIDDVLQFSDQITMQDEIQMQKFLESCLKEKNREELQDAIGLKNRDYFRKKYLNPAVEAGLLALTIPDKPNSKHQKYRLTEKGKMFLKNRTKQHE